MADQRPEDIEDIFGEVALERGVVNEEQLESAKERRRARLEQGQTVRLGEAMMELGLISKEQALAILKEAHIQSGHKPRIGGYQLDKCLGKGAMGAVYLAHQVSMDRKVALKLLPRRVSRDKRFVKRFLREAKTCARLNHPNVVSAIDVGESNGYHYFAMEFVEGESLEAVLRKKGMIDEEWALDIAAQVVKGLAHAAGHHIIHRDIKPANIMVCDDGTVKIADLGLAIAVDENTSSSSVTAEGHTAGTPYYMAPEQVEGKRDVDFRADIYALGASLFEALSGEKPWDAANVPAIMARRLYEEPVLTCSVNSKVSKDFSAVIQKMMARQREERYQSFPELLEDLDRLVEGEKPEAVPQAAPKKKKARKAGPKKKTRPRKQKKALWVYGAVAAAVAVVLAVVLMAALQPPPAPVHPRGEQADASLWDKPLEKPPRAAGDVIREQWVAARNLHASLLAAEEAPPAEWRRLRDQYEELASDYPDSSYGKLARAKLADVAPRAD